MLYSRTVSVLTDADVVFVFCVHRVAILFDVIRNIQFATKTEAELIIRQGDQGDW